MHTCTPRYLSIDFFLLGLMEESEPKCGCIVGQSSCRIVPISRIILYISYIIPKSKLHDFTQIE